MGSGCKVVNCDRRCSHEGSVIQKWVILIGMCAHCGYPFPLFANRLCPYALIRHIGWPAPVCRVARASPAEQLDEDVLVWTTSGSTWSKYFGLGWGPGIVGCVGQLFYVGPCCIFSARPQIKDQERLQSFDGTIPKNAATGKRSAPGFDMTGNVSRPPQLSCVPGSAR